MTSPPLLEVDDLHLHLQTAEKNLPILNGLSFKIYPGEIVGLVGESGCGKSMTASALLGLLPLSHQLTGHIYFEGHNLLALPEKAFRQLQGTRFGLILQDPGLALNPVRSIGTQLVETLCYHKKLSHKQAWEKGIEWLSRVGIGDASLRMRQYPHELSGGMKQRVLIAMSLLCQPSLLIADEPTTALDLTVQAQILDLLQDLQQQERMSILLITHDLGVVARCCQRVMVMQAGHLVEVGTVEQVLTDPQHPYTHALLQARHGLEGFYERIL